MLRSSAAPIHPVRRRSVFAPPFPSRKNYPFPALEIITLRQLAREQTRQQREERIVLDQLLTMTRNFPVGLGGDSIGLSLPENQPQYRPNTGPRCHLKILYSLYCSSISN